MKFAIYSILLVLSSITQCFFYLNSNMMSSMSKSSSKTAIKALKTSVELYTQD